jgi:hypothetical protein
MARISSPSQPLALHLQEDAHACPLCGGSNGCRLAACGDAGVGCWCHNVNIPAGLIAQVPARSRDRACICRDCVETFQAERTPGRIRLLPGDFYFDKGFMVFTAAYLRRRGHCCDNNCRHCPYRETRD